MSSIMKGIVDEAEAFDYDRLKAMPAKERITYLRDKPELRNLYNAEMQKRIDAELNNYSWMTPEEKAEYERLAKTEINTKGMHDKSFAAEKYLKQLFQQKMDAKKAAAMLKIHWAPLEDLQKYLTGQISPKTELSAYLAKSPEDLGKVRWGTGTIGIVIDGHITIGGRGDLGSDQYKEVNGVRGQQKYASRPGQIDPTFDTLDLGKHHEVLVDNWKIREIVLPADIPENVDAMIKKAGIPVRRLQSVNEEQLDENLHKWFKEKWVRFGPDGKIRGDCARGDDSEGKPKCLPQKKAHALGKKGRKYAASKKRREDPNPERRGKAKNVATKKKTNEEKCPHCGGELVSEELMNEKQDACYRKVKARYKVWPSAYASGALVQCRKKGAANWGNKSKKKNESSVMKGLVDESTNFVTENILTEGKILLEGRVVRKLWESAGQKIVEAQLTPQQIQQIFQAAEKGQTQAGGNRTIAGKGVDAASAVNRAWEDLKTKVQNSGPIQNMDAMYDKAAEALKNATGGDQGAMAYVQKYRDFAEKHPVAQSFLYAALIAAAGLSGAGAGGAAALGLLKMTDKLLQGQKFSSAAYSGAKTGGLAYAAGQIGQQLKGTDAAQPAGAPAAQPTSSDIGLPYDKEEASQLHDIMWQQQQDAAAKAAHSSLPAGDPSFKDFSSMVDPNQASLPDGDPSFKDFSSMVEPDQAEKAASAAKSAAAKAAKAQAAGMNESVQLSKYQVFSIMEAVILYHQALNEGLMDKIKGAASKVGQYAATKGHNITTKITADKLLQAWKKAGSPTDSEQVKAVLKSAGVADNVINTVMPVQASIAGVQPKATTGNVTTTIKSTTQPAAPAQAAQPTSAIGQGVAKAPNANVNPELQKRLAARKAGKPVYAGGLEEGVIVSHDATDPEIAILGGAGTMSLSRLKKKAQAEANMLANDLAKGAFKSAAYNIKQLENSLATIKAAEEEMEKKYFGEDTDMRYAAEKTPEINPYGGEKDIQHRGAISETPTDNPTGASGEGGWRTYKPKSAGTVEEDTAYATGMGQGGNAGQSYRKFTPKSAGTFKEEEQLDEKCWDGYKQVGMKKKGDKMVPNCVAKESAIMKGLTGKRD